MNWNTRRDFRKIHRWGAVLVALPFLVVLITGIFLQVKKEFAWIQPPTQTGSISNENPGIAFPRILDIAINDTDAGISSWADVDRLDVRPDDGIVKVRSRTNWELQIDLGTGEILISQKRRSDIIESLHDGSWFHDQAKLGFFLPSAIIVAALWITGLYLFFLPYFARWQNRRILAQRIRERRRKKQNKKGSDFN